MPRTPPDLSRTEWVVMNLCWDSAKSTARQIYEQALLKKKWSYHTVKTMLDRLAAKGYLRREKLGPLCLYEPAIPRSRVVDRSIAAFWDTVLGNTFAPLFAHLAKGKRLSEEEIAALKKLVEKSEPK